MTWIMLWVVVGGSASTGINSTEFSTKESCVSASVVAKQMVLDINSWIRIGVECVPKGE